MILSNYFNYLDEADYDVVLNNTVYAYKTSHQAKTMYARLFIKDKNYYIHRIIAERIIGRKLNKFEKVDHIDGNGLNNKRENLRICSHRENMRNMKCLKINGTSAYKGVCFLTKQKKWEAKIMKDYKNIYIGRYETEVEAAHAYNKKAIELFGEFACINKIKEG